MDALANKHLCGERIPQQRGKLFLFFVQPIVLLFGATHFFLCEIKKSELIFLVREDFDFSCGNRDGKIA